MGSCAAPSAKGDDKFITTDYLQQCQRSESVSEEAEYLLYRIFCLRSAAAFFFCRIRRFPDYRTHANILSQYTLR
ncbi:hypothetical protein, partial [Klebsiella pneumoniae]|uniref:hypothetical protein n=1 Tax=Klebsiella pneumoniae TaxID=573 RepID=UPI0034E564A4